MPKQIVRLVRLKLEVGFKTEGKLPKSYQNGSVGYKQHFVPGSTYQYAKADGWMHRFHEFMVGFYKGTAGNSGGNKPL